MFTVLIVSSIPLLFVSPILVNMLLYPVKVGMVRFTNRSFVLLLYTSIEPPTRSPKREKSKPTFAVFVVSHFRFEFSIEEGYTPTEVAPPSPKTYWVVLDKPRDW